MATRKVILVLSGEICTGKTTLSDKLVDQFNFEVFKTKEVLQIIASEKIKKREISRIDLQEFGENLDVSTKGRWVIEHFQKQFFRKIESTNLIVIDSARILDQIRAFREAYSIYVVHIHLSANPKTLYSRYVERMKATSSLTVSEIKSQYSKVKNNNTETKVNELKNDADLVIDTDKCNKSDIVTRVASYLRLLPTTENNLVDVIVGGQFGSEGKGQIAAYLAPDYDCLVRVGGPNAGHSVHESPKKDTFHLLPSGTRRNSKAKLILGPGTIINIDKLLEEINKFGVEDTSRLIIDKNASIISNQDIKYEVLRKTKIGSTAQGVGHATANNILNRINGSDKHKAKNYFKKLKPYLGDTHEELEKCYARGEKILLEGTQGTGLSIHHGIYPFVTSRDTTVSGCLSEAGISPRRLRKVIMVTRTYPIRVGGKSGPFISDEIDWKEVALRSGKDFSVLKELEKTTTTNRDRRVAEFSYYLFRRACELNSPTDIALTFTDYITIKNQDSIRYDQLSDETRIFIEELERASGVNVSLISTSFSYRAVIDRRNWK